MESDDDKMEIDYKINLDEGIRHANKILDRSMYENISEISQNNSKTKTSLKAEYKTHNSHLNISLGTNNLELLYDFIKKNEEELIYTPKTLHGFNIKRANEWIRAQTDKDLKLFAQKVTENTVDVSFKTFKTQLYNMFQTIINEISSGNGTQNITIVKKKYKDKNVTGSLITPDYYADGIFSNVKNMFFSKASVYKNIILVIDDALEKSNSWISFLFLLFLFDNYTYYDNEFQTRISDLLDDTNIYIVSNTIYIPPIFIANNFESTLVLHFDDVSYSGSQIMLALSNIKDFVDTSSSELKYKLVRNLKYIIGVPFIGFSAIEKFHLFYESNPYINVYIPEVSTVFFSLNKLLENKGESLDYKKTLLNNQWVQVFYQYQNNVSAIYFSHKLADSVSIFQKIYAFGPVFDIAKNSISRVGSLIENCESSKYEDNVFLEDTVDIKDCNNKPCYICPEAFYKKIKYFSKNGYPINSTKTHIIDYILLENAKLY